MNRKKSGIVVALLHPKNSFIIGLFFILLPVVFMSKNLVRYDLIAGGDFYQLYEPEKHLARYFYAWLNQVGQGYFNVAAPSAPYYALEALISSTGFTKYINFPLLFFMLLSYLSFYYSIKKLNPSISKFWQTCFSGFYSYNYITLSIFTYPWGYTHQYLIYIFIPLILTYFLEIINKEKVEIKTVAAFILINSLANISYSNIGFMLGIFLIEALLAYTTFAVGKSKFISITARLIMCLIIQAVLLGPFLYTFVTVNIGNFSAANTSKVFGGSMEQWNTFTSSSFIDAAVMRPANSILPFLPAYILLPLVLFIGSRRNEKDDLKYSSAIVCILFLVVFAAKFNGPFGQIFRLLFNFPLASVFRSPEKLFIFLPFFYIYLISQLLNAKTSKILQALYLGLIISSWFAFLGNSATKYITTSKNNYKYAIDIPTEYKNIAGEINNTSRDTSIISLPYSVKNSINWSNYPAWGFVGHDVLHLLFDRFYISANTFDHPNLETEMSFKDWGAKKTTSEEDLTLFQSFSTEYIIWHKDISPDRLMQGRNLYEKLLNLRDLGYLHLIESNNYFELYKLSDEYVVPVISSNKTVALEYTKINPTEYRIKFDGIKPNDYLLFNQSFDRGWQLYPNSNSKNFNCKAKQEYLDGAVTQCLSGTDKLLRLLIVPPSLWGQHTMVNNYANKWVLGESDLKEMVRRGAATKTSNGTYSLQLTLLYVPQIYLPLQFYLSILAGIASIAFLLITKVKTHETRSHSNNGTYIS